MSVYIFKAKYFFCRKCIKIDFFFQIRVFKAVQFSSAGWKNNDNGNLIIKYVKY